MRIITFFLTFLCIVAALALCKEGMSPEGDIVVKLFQMLCGVAVFALGLLIIGYTSLKD